MNKLHVFCGPIYLDGWINLDISGSHKTDACGDILKAEFEENSLDAIYGCHGLEHLNYPDDTVKFLELAYKWLKPGGVLRLAVPDLELAARAYMSHGDLSFLYGKDFKAYYHKDKPAERLNFFIKAWNHQICYDFDLLGSLLQDAGFKIIFRREPNESSIPDFDHDRFVSESLYVEAIK